MIILDTNVISEFTRTNASPFASNWLREQSFDDLGTCAPVASELWYGAQRVFHRDGSHRYIRAFEDMIENVVSGRVLPFDMLAAKQCAEVRVLRSAMGRPVGLFDAMIAGICMVNGATLATRNIDDFAGLDLKLVNPFEGG